MQIEIESVAYHRNGISGLGFHVVIFRWAEDKDEPRPMVAVVFPEIGACAVLDREMTRQGNVEFAAGNSWRGDHFESAMRSAIQKYDEEQTEKFRQWVREH